MTPDTYHRNRPTQPPFYAQVVANRLAGLAGAVEALPGKWKNVMAVSIKVGTRGKGKGKGKGKEKGKGASAGD